MFQVTYANANRGQIKNYNNLSGYSYIVSVLQYRKK